MILNVGLFIALCIFCALVDLLLCFGDVGSVMLPFRFLMSQVCLGTNFILDDLLGVCLHLFSFPDSGTALGMVIILVVILGGTFNEPFFFEDVSAFVQSRISVSFNFLSLT